MGHKLGAFIGHTAAVRVSEWKQTVRPLLRTDEGWRFRGGLVYRLPVDRFLLGVLAEGSGFDRGVYLWRVSMPLFVPSEHIDLSYSQRIGGGSAKFGRDDTEALDSAIRSALQTLPTQDHEMARLADLQCGRNVLASEVSAYCNIYLGRVNQAASIIEAALDTDGTSTWEVAARDRLRDVQDHVLSGDVHIAAARLDAQAVATAGALGLARN